MTIKKETNAIPFVEGMTLREDSWLAIKVETTNKPVVIFYNAEEDKDDPLTFREFAQCILDEHFNYSVRNGAVVEISDTKAQANGGTSSEQDDYDDETKKQWKVWVADCEVVQIYKEEKASNIAMLIKEAEKKLTLVEMEYREEAKDSSDYKKDPNGYFGVKVKL